MKLYALLLTLAFAAGAIGHEDHALGEGVGHSLYHGIFLLVMALVIYKALGYVLQRIKKNR